MTVSTPRPRQATWRRIEALIADGADLARDRRERPHAGPCRGLLLA